MLPIITLGLNNPHTTSTDFGIEIFSFEIENFSLFVYSFFIWTIWIPSFSNPVGRVGSYSDYKAISAQLQLELPTGTELGNIQINFPNHTESIPQDVDDF